VYYYELHEGDADLFADLLLARDEEMPPDVFFEVVQEIRRRVQETFAQDTLIEAIAEELEREHDFIFISDKRLTAAVNVSSNEEENFLADLDGTYDDFDGEDELDIGDADYLTIAARLADDEGVLPN
jgi:hypothetical protein